MPQTNFLDWRIVLNFNLTINIVRGKLKAKDFIGTKLFGGKIEVIGISHVDKRKVTHFKVECSECAKDPELFGEGVFISRKDNLENGKCPCGCSKTYRHSQQQFITLINRVSDGAYKVIDFPDKRQPMI